MAPVGWLCMCLPPAGWLSNELSAVRCHCRGVARKRREHVRLESGVPTSVPSRREKGTVPCPPSPSGSTLTRRPTPQSRSTSYHALCTKRVCGRVSPRTATPEPPRGGDERSSISDHLSERRRADTVHSARCALLRRSWSYRATSIRQSLARGTVPVTGLPVEREARSLRPRLTRLNRHKRRQPNPHRWDPAGPRSREQTSLG